MIPGKLYLSMTHGRDSADEDMEDWGFDGPSFGPLSDLHIIYMSSLRLTPENADEAIAADYVIKIHEDMLTYDGKFYGDWSLFIAK